MEGDSIQHNGDVAPEKYQSRLQGSDSPNAKPFKMGTKCCPETVVTI